MAQRSPLGRLAKPEDIAAAALYFASDDSAYVTGRRIAVDGGMSIVAVERSQRRVYFCSTYFIITFTIKGVLLT